MGEIMSVAARILTAEEVERCAIEGRWELIEGEVKQYMPVRPEHGECVQRIATAVQNALKESHEALMGPEIGFLVKRHPDTVRAPDWSLTWREEAQQRRAGAWIEGAPDLVVEVISPEDTWLGMEQKVEEYLSAGAQLVLIMNPYARTIHAFRKALPVRILRAGDILTGEPVLPSFSVPVEDLLPPVDPLPIE